MGGGMSGLDKYLRSIRVSERDAQLSDAMELREAKKRWDKIRKDLADDQKRRDEAAKRLAERTAKFGRIP